MKIAVLGTGMVGETIGSKLVALGHEVKMGSRSPDNPKARAWVAKAGGGASQGTFEDAARFGEILFNCTAGTASIEALEAAGRQNLAGKLLIDLANPLDFSAGMPPSLSIVNTDSLGEQIQRVFPETRVVKTLNTVNATVMVNPGSVPGDHDLFVSGNDDAAKAQAIDILTGWFGWKRENVIDLGDISTARGTEMLLPLWLRLMFAFGGPQFNFHVVRGPSRPA